MVLSTNVRIIFHTHSVVSRYVPYLYTMSWKYESWYWYVAIDICISTCTSRTYTLVNCPKLLSSAAPRSMTGPTYLRTYIHINEHMCGTTVLFLFFENWKGKKPRSFGRVHYRTILGYGTRVRYGDWQPVRYGDGTDFFLHLVLRTSTARLRGQ